LVKETCLLKFVRLCFHLARQEIPSYRSKFSKHTYTQPQLIVLNCLKVKRQFPYRELVDELEEMPRVREVLGLKVVPHFTTVQKAFSRLSMLLWRILLNASASLLQRGEVVVIDTSGFERHYASHFYTRRGRLKISAIKTTFLGDIKSLGIIDLYLTTTRKHDTQIAPRLAMRNLDAFSVLLGDKGYDDHGFRLALRREGKRALIKHREFRFWDKGANVRI
jgi:IS5 family transposase